MPVISDVSGAQRRVDQSTNQMRQADSELAAAQSQLNSAVAGGVAKGSPEWFTLKNQVNSAESFKETVQMQLNTDLSELGQAQSYAAQEARAAATPTPIDTTSRQTLQEQSPYNGADSGARSGGTETNAPSYAGGYYGDQTEAGGGGYNPNIDGGGYDPNNPGAYVTTYNSIGGSAAISQDYNGAPSFNAASNGYDPNTIESTGGGYDPNAGDGVGNNTAADLADPKNQRPGSKIAGGEAGAGKASPQVGFQSASRPEEPLTPADNDWRVRVSLSPNAKIFYQDQTMQINALMAPLAETNGVIWPYTPTVAVTHTANYTPAALTHSNYAAQFYNNSEVQDITISGDFTVQNVEDGQYLMAVIYFFRSATKMFFGQGADMGNPPPIVFLDGYGSHYFPHVPCVVTSFAHTMPNEIDYVEIPILKTTLMEVPVTETTAGNNMGAVNLSPDEQKFVPNWNHTGSAAQDAKLAANNARASATKMEYSTITTKSRLPTNSTVSVTLRPVYSRKNLHERFDLRKFAAGDLLRDRKNGYGGFI